MTKEEYISYEKIEKFMSNYCKEKLPIFSSMEQYAEQYRIPIIKREVADYIRFQLLVQNPKNILEVGTAIGYSSIWMANCLNDCIIDTLEINSDIIKIAKKNISDSSYEGRINIIAGDALNTIKDIEKTYDFAFIDAAKGHYKEFWDLILPKMNPQGIILCDNILIRGLVCLDFEDIPKKHRTFTRKMKSFLDYIFDEERVNSVILPIGDGLLISYIL